MFIIFGIASQKWPTTEALITESDLKNGTTGFGTKAYWPIVKYNYQIGDEKFIGKRIAFGKYGTKWNNTYKKEIAQNISERYKIGQSTLVHYLPFWKNISVLEAGFSWGALGLFAIGFFWMFMGLYLLNLK